MDRDTIISLLMTSARELWSRTLDGERSAWTEAMYHVLSNPRPGDLVLEITRRSNDLSRFGRLLRIVKEPIEGEWDEAVDGPRPSDTYWYIENANGEECKWYNCQFIRVLEQCIDPIKEAKARGVVTPELARRLQEIEERVASYVAWGRQP